MIERRYTPQLSKQLIAISNQLVMTPELIVSSLLAPLISFWNGNVLRKTFSSRPLSAPEITARVC